MSNPRVYLDVSINEGPPERMVIELFANVVPRIAENFRAICVGSVSATGKFLHYKGRVFSIIHEGSYALGGVSENQDDTADESIYGGSFPEEDCELKHSGPGFLMMASCGRNEVGCQFLLTFCRLRSLYGHAVFGKVIKGMDTVLNIEQAGTFGRVRITGCGEISDGKVSNMMESDKPQSSSDNNLSNMSTVLQTKELRPEDKGFYCSVRGYFPEVWNQSKPSSFAMSATHMLTIIYRRKNKNPNLRISPRALLAKMTNIGIFVEDLDIVLQGFGLEEYDQSEYDMTKSVYEEAPNFVYRRGPTYGVKRLVHVSGIYNIMCALRKNFDANGAHYPLVVLCYQMGSLADDKVASQTTMDNPYRWGAFNSHGDEAVDNDRGITNNGLQHAMLLTGLYIMCDQPKPMDYSVELKNSWGTQWGVGGYVWATPDLFETLIVPVMHGDPE